MAGKRTPKQPSPRAAPKVRNPRVTPDVRRRSRGPEAQREALARQDLDAFIDRFTPEVAALARRAIARMRKLTPGAVELVYDNYNALAIGFGATERSSESVFSIALFPSHPSLFFLQGAGLPDPHDRLTS
jgi:hypothetical protein